MEDQKADSSRNGGSPENMDLVRGSVEEAEMSISLCSKQIGLSETRRDVFY